jgi:serine/threonine protein kinase
VETESGFPILESDLPSYRLIQELVANQTFLCCDVSENIVVLKRLEDDCLHRQQLHPSIKDRLARVRELAHPRIATLRTVERWNGIACLVWTYLDGETWEDAMNRPDQNVPALCSSLAAAVDALHEAGIVHGSLHGRNIIVRPDRQVWLTHISPYLYADPLADLVALIELLRHTSERLSADISLRFNQLLDELDRGQHTLREFSHLVLDIEKQSTEPVIAPTEKPRRHRSRSILGAAVILTIALTLWIEIHAMISKSESSLPTTFPTLTHSPRQ